jgi:ATP adenylyltransferase
LNKFPIIPQHFILATKINKPQTHLLEENDLAVTYACLKEWEKEGEGRRLFAFFNSGGESGASQAHRHLQFLPVECIREGTEGDDWKLFIDVVEEGSGNEQGMFDLFYPDKPNSYEYTLLEHRLPTP